LVSGVWKKELRITGLKKNVVQPSHNLVAVLDSKINPKRTAIISYPCSELDLLSRASRIRRHIEIFDEQGTHARRPHAPSLISSPGAKFLCQVDRPLVSLNIHLYREAGFLSMKPVAGLGESNSIVPWSDREIVDSGNHFISVLDKEANPSGMAGAVRNDGLEAHPFTLPHGVRVHL
jgi:hypothetical protein